MFGYKGELIVLNSIENYIVTNITIFFFIYTNKMNQNTKLVLFLKNIQRKTRKKVLFFEEYFANGVFFLFLGFLSGNIFGTFLNIFHKTIVWDGFLILILILFEEFISYLTYHSKKRTNFFKFDFISVEKFFFKKKNFLYIDTFLPKNIQLKWSQLFLLYKQPFFLKSLNLFKIGILLGFFIDAFKVGS